MFPGFYFASQTKFCILTFPNRPNFPSCFLAACQEPGLGFHQGFFLPNLCGAAIVAGPGERPTHSHSVSKYQMGQHMHPSTGWELMTSIRNLNNTATLRLPRRSTARPMIPANRVLARQSNIRARLDNY